MSTRLCALAVPAAFAAVYSIWGSTYAAIAVAVEDLPPLTMAAARWTLAGGALYALSRARGAPAPGARAWRHGAIAGALLIALGNGLVCWAEARIDSGLAATLLAITPFLVVLLDWIALRGERPAPATWAALALGLVGVAILAGPSLSSDLGALAALSCAALAWAVGALYLRHRGGGAPGLMGSATQMIAGGVALALAGAAVGEPWPTSVSLEAGLAVGYLAVFGSIVGFGAFGYLARRVEPALLATHSFVNPVIAVMLGWLVLGERLDPRGAVGATLVVGAVALSVLRPRALAGPVASTR
ncbi:MAG: EamA family transporter [Sandaracinaceae bacterium]|nr:EamA family transporter [Sandaracinaceae bacterium]